MFISTKGFVLFGRIGRQGCLSDVQTDTASRQQDERMAGGGGFDFQYISFPNNQKAIAEGVQGKEINVIQRRDITRYRREISIASIHYLLHSNPDQKLPVHAAVPSTLPNNPIPSLHIAINTPGQTHKGNS